jgi:hypothetical protein
VEATTWWGPGPWAFVVRAASEKLHGGYALTRIGEGRGRDVAEGHQEGLKCNSIREVENERWLKGIEKR